MSDVIRHIGSDLTFRRGERTPKGALERQGYEVLEAIAAGNFGGVDGHARLLRQRAVEVAGAQYR